MSESVKVATEPLTPEQREYIVGRVEKNQSLGPTAQRMLLENFYASESRCRELEANMHEVRQHVKERLKQHLENVHLWDSDYLTPTEPDPRERLAIRRELMAAIAELRTIEPLLAASGGERGKP